MIGFARHAAVERHFSGAASVAGDRRMWKHLKACERCRAQYRTLAMLEAWLFQITRRIVANARRSAWVRRIFKRDGSEAQPAFEASGADTEQELAVRRCFAKLSPMHREVLLLAGVEGYTTPEAAKMLDVPEGTVASRLRLARAAFAREWEAR